jgi:HTH-type transcriptional regulator/antitoxin HipB
MAEYPLADSYGRSSRRRGVGLVTNADPRVEIPPQRGFGGRNRRSTHVSGPIAGSVRPLESVGGCSADSAPLAVLGVPLGPPGGLKVAPALDVGAGSRRWPRLWTSALTRHGDPSTWSRKWLLRAADQTERSMDDQRFGSVVRAVRQRRGWRQSDLARRAKVSQPTISRVERGHSGSLPLDVIRRAAAALDIRVDLVARWRAGDLDRLLSARHSRLHELVARSLAQQSPDWVLTPEVSFSIFGERGIVDLVAWNAIHRSLLMIELKTEIVDVNELIGTFDRKVRLGWAIAKERSWDPLAVSGWVIVAPGRVNRERIATHRSMLRAAFPMDGRAVNAWLRRPVGRVSALSLWRNSTAGTTKADLTPVRRVRRPRRNVA